MILNMDNTCCHDSYKAIIEGIVEELRWTVRDTGIIVDAAYETFTVIGSARNQRGRMIFHSNK